MATKQDLDDAITRLEEAEKNRPAPDFTEQVKRLDAVTAAIPAPPAPVAPPAPQP